jgi:3-methyladenine DNA glycosylase AlkD
LGLRVPHIRLVAKKYKDLSMQDIQSLLQTNVHEWRLIALFILTKQFDQALKKKDIEKCKNMYDFYLKNTKYINNRDLVDLSTPHIIGKYILYQIEKQAA